MNTHTAPKYLIIGPSWVGDMVMAQSVFMEIKKQHQHAQIDVLSPQWSAAIVSRMPQVHALIGVDFQHGKLALKQRYQVAKSLRAKEYTHSVVLPNSLKSALVPFLAGIPQRIGYVGEQRWGLLNVVRRLNKETLPMTVQRFVSLVRDAQDSCAISSIEVPKLESSEIGIHAALLKYGLQCNKKVLVVCPGAEFGASKQWPAEYYAQVAKQFSAQGWQIWLMGSANDVPICQKIAAISVVQCEMLAGITSLTEAIDLIACADAVVSNDSGLMHIAAACNAPLVALYGSTNPNHTPPLNKNVRILYKELACQPCHKRQCPLKHHDCMTQLSAEEVCAAIEELLV